jgi:lactoylglutathione lyase
MSTITDVRTVAVTVADQDHALGFYRDTLGFEVRLDGDAGPLRWIEVAPVGAAVSIALTAGEPAQDVTETGIRFTAPDAAAEHHSLTERGVDVGELLRWPGVPAMFSFNDPDGNQYIVVEHTQEDPT